VELPQEWKCPMYILGALQKILAITDEKVPILRSKIAISHLEFCQEIFVLNIQFCKIKFSFQITLLAEPPQDHVISGMIYYIYLQFSDYIKYLIF